MLEWLLAEEEAVVAEVARQRHHLLQFRLGAVAHPVLQCSQQQLQVVAVVEQHQHQCQHHLSLVAAVREIRVLLQWSPVQEEAAALPQRQFQLLLLAAAAALQQNLCLLLLSTVVPPQFKAPPAPARAPQRAWPMAAASSSA